MPEIPANALAEVLDDRFSPPASSQEYAILQAFKALHPETTRHVALVDLDDYQFFPLVKYLESSGVEIDVLHNPRHELISWAALTSDGREAPWRYYDGVIRSANGKLVAKLNAGAMKFTYSGTEFIVYKISWYQPAIMSVQTSLYDIVFDGPLAECETLTSVGHKLAADVFRWAGALKDEIWVFQEGHWKKDKALWDSVQNASWDNVCLEPEFLNGLRRDIRTFFDNKKVYQRLGIAWKRGILMLGPPGNGKTESIKVLLKESGHTALYVKSFKSDRGAEYGVREIFDHARANSPCVLVIEDLDSLVSADIRSFFLNELDGLTQNEGILTIASTNHPELIDDSILNRPSRFDVKYHFNLPSENLRKSYALKWVRKIHGPGSDETSGVEFSRSETDLAEEISKRTTDWSFAFLKELFTSFLLRVAHEQSKIDNEDVGSESILGFCDKILFEQVDDLQRQIIQTNAQVAANAAPEKDASESIPSVFDFSGVAVFLSGITEAFGS